MAYFQNTPVQNLSASFYASSQVLQLNEAYIEELGVFKASFQLSKPADELLLTLTQAELLTDKQESDIHYSRVTGLLTIPRLVVQNSHHEKQFYQVVLQQVENAVPLQFQVSSLQAINP